MWDYFAFWDKQIFVQIVATKSHLLLWLGSHLFLWEFEQNSARIVETKISAVVCFFGLAIWAEFSIVFYLKVFNSSLQPIFKFFIISLKIFLCNIFDISTYDQSQTTKGYLNDLDHVRKSIVVYIAQSGTKYNWASK